jgi:hypothetical protein
VEVLELVHDGGEADAPLPGDAGLQDADAFVAQLLLEAVLDLARELAPIAAGVPEFHLAVLDPEIDGRVGLAVDGDGVVARRPQLGSPPAPGLRLAVGAGERRLGRGRVAVGSREGQAVDDARREDEDVVGAERVDAGRQVPEEDVAGEGAAPQVLTEDGLRDLLDAGLTRREVHVEQLGSHGRWHRGSSLEAAPAPGRRRRGVSPTLPEGSAGVNRVTFRPPRRAARPDSG